MTIDTTNMWALRIITKANKLKKHYYDTIGTKK